MFAKTTNVYLMTEDGGTLLLLRSPFDENMPLFWETPGGHLDCVCFLDDLEAIKSEALRELQEETNLELRPESLKYYAPGSSDVHISWVAHVSPEVLQRLQLSSEHSASKVFYHPSELPKKIRPQVEAFIRSELK